MFFRAEQANQQYPEVNGARIKEARESRGISRADLAHQTCLSIKNITEIEEGGRASFYSYAIKWTAAKRVSSHLGMTADQLIRVDNAY